jgi:predicted nucleic acid-binding protein
MRAAVIDASVAAKWVVEEAHSAQAALALKLDARHAPAHWLAEAVNVLWAKVSRGDLTAADAEERVAVLLRAPVTAAPLEGLVPRAFAIGVARGVTIYDALYVALAEKYDIPMVWVGELSA